MTADVAALQFQLAALNLPAPSPEYRFCDRRWRFDLAYVPQKLAIEVDGGTWQVSRHTTGAGYERDCEKLAEATVLGWRVLRFTTSMIHDGRAMRYVERALRGE